MFSISEAFRCGKITTSYLLLFFWNWWSIDLFFLWKWAAWFLRRPYYDVCCFWKAANGLSRYSSFLAVLFFFAKEDLILVFKLSRSRSYWNKVYEFVLFFNFNIFILYLRFWLIFGIDLFLPYYWLEIIGYEEFRLSIFEATFESLFAIKPDSSLTICG